MTTRKPPGVSVPDWVEHQIRAAQAAGAFDDLPGAGRPLPDLDRPRHELAWVANYLKREDVDVAGLLPPALALAKEVEVLPERLRREHSEAAARQVVTDLNERIEQAHAAPQVGPPMRVKTVNVAAVLDQWRQQRSEPAAAPPTAAPAPNRRRRWFDRR